MHIDFYRRMAISSVWVCGSRDFKIKFNFPHKKLFGNEIQVIEFYKDMMESNKQILGTVSFCNFGILTLTDSCLGSNSLQRTSQS